MTVYQLQSFCTDLCKRSLLIVVNKCVIEYGRKVSKINAARKMQQIQKRRLWQYSILPTSCLSKLDSCSILWGCGRYNLPFIQFREYRVLLTRSKNPSVMFTFSRSQIGIHLLGNVVHLHTIEA